MRSHLQQPPIRSGVSLFTHCTLALLLTALFLPIALPVVDSHAAQKAGQDVYYGTTAPLDSPRAPHLSEASYPTQYGESRLVVWMVAQQHLYWGGLAMGALMLVTLLEIGAMLGRSDRSPAGDRWAYEILRIVMGGFSVAALLGAGFGVCLLILYPDLTGYLVRILRSWILIYVVLALVLTVLAYSYYYSWQVWNRGTLKYLHASVGILANVVATTLVLLANGWSSFMLSPAGVDQYGRFLGNDWHTLHTATWNVFNVHRILSHLVLASAVFAGFATYRAIRATTEAERAEAERRSQRCLVAMAAAFLFLPFQGYWLVREIYAYRQQMGITQLGGLLAWLGQVRSLLVAGLFLGINYYVWQRISVLDHGRLEQQLRKYVFLILALCMAVYITPHTIVMTKRELFNIGGQQHPVVGNYGVEAAKQTAANIMILVTIGSWYLWRRAGIKLTARQSFWAGPVTVGVFVAAAINLLWAGIYGYYIPANVRVGVLMTSAVTPFMVLGYVLLMTRSWSDRNAGNSAAIRQPTFLGHWIVFALAFLVTWLMGLGGYLRSSVRLFWHVNEIVRDESPWAHTHSIGFAGNVISLNALLFWAGLLLLFWLSRAHGTENEPQAAPSSVDLSDLGKAGSLP